MALVLQVFFLIKNGVLRGTLIQHIKILSEGIIWHSWSENKGFPLNTHLRSWHWVMQSLRHCSSIPSGAALPRLSPNAAKPQTWNQWPRLLPLQLQVRTNLKRGSASCWGTETPPSTYRTDASRGCAGHLALRADRLPCWKRPNVSYCTARSGQELIPVRKE